MAQNIKHFCYELIFKQIKICSMLCTLYSTLYTPLVHAADTTRILTPGQYNTIEQFLSPKVREKLRPSNARYATGANRSLVRQASNATRLPFSNFSGQSNTGGQKTQRRVVARRGAGVARNAAVAQPIVRATSSVSNQARAAATGAVQNNSQRKVVQRARAGSRLQGSNAQQRDSAAPVPTPQFVTTGDIAPEQCLANYTECMDRYCERPNTQYDRCYCSARLQQADATYKPAIDELVKKITVLKSGGAIPDGMSQDEINEFWKTTFGSDSMASLDEALNISWAGMESSARGQNAFVAGDTFCRGHLKGCDYMSENLRSMYRTTIGQDCKKYETYLQRMKYAAEQVVASF